MVEMDSVLRHGPPGSHLVELDRDCLCAVHPCIGQLGANTGRQVLACSTRQKLRLGRCR